MKKLLSAIMCLCLIGTLVACGNQATTDGGNQAITDEGSTTNKQTQDISAESDEEIKEVIFGNSPNNLLQSTDTMCFAENRVFYLNCDYSLCSFQMDGSDWQEHCVISNSKLFEQNPCLNYYQGGIYFMAGVKISDTVRALEIRRYDLTEGTVEVIYTFTPESGFAISKNMLIVDDNLCCAYSFSGEGKTNVEVINLTTGKSNSITSGKAEGGTTNFGFDTDGIYLYMIWDGGVNDAGMKRVLLSELYEENPTVEKLFDRPYYQESYVLDDGGLYAAVRNSDDETIYGFYSHEVLSGEAYELTLQEIAPVTYKNYPETEQEYINNLGFDTTTTDYILDGARVSVKNTNNGGLELYHSNNFDWRESVLVAKPAHGANSPTNHYHVGEYEEILYFVLEDENGDATLHSITANGNYQ